MTRADKYTRKASRTSSERVRCSALIARSISLAIAGGRETLNVVLSLMRCYFVILSDNYQIQMGTIT
jgi:hypothetical protein